MKLMVSVRAIEEMAAWRREIHLQFYRLGWYSRAGVHTKIALHLLKGY